MNGPRPSPVVAAAGQLESRLMNEAPATLERIGELIREAARQKVHLLVLPECAYPAYLLGSPESYRQGEHLSSEEFVQWLAQQAGRYELHVVCGYVEDTGAALFNSAILLDRRGREIGRTRKRFLWHVDQDWFQPGDEIAPFDTELGRIGIIICAEARVPEIIATLAADGAELIAMPTCWINNSRQPGEYHNPQVEFLIEARAGEFGLPFICADKAGLEITTGYVGQSCIVTPEAGMLVKAPAIGEALIVSELRPRPAPRPWMSEQRRRRLLDELAANTPGRSAAAPAVLAAISTSLCTRQFTGRMGEALFEPLRKQGVSLLFANVAHEADAQRMNTLARAFDMEAVGFPSRTQVFTVAGTRVGCMAGQWLASFASARALALDAAEVLVYFDAADDLPLLRTRALENRVFVVGVDNESSTIVAPDGIVLARGTAEAPAVAAVDLAEASDKQVAPRTDVFPGRRPALYRF